MSKDLTTHKPQDFGLASFYDLLSSRPHIPGEQPGGFDALRSGLLASLTPATPYECVVAESIVAIEWELLQRRRMRDATLRGKLREAITTSAMSIAQSLHDADVQDARKDAWDAFSDPENEEIEWEDPHPFDRDAAEERVAELADGILSNDPLSQADAHQALTDLGVPLLNLMGNAYADGNGLASRHEAKVQELERRRREVMRDFHSIQKARPIDHVTHGGDISEAELVAP
jgi:hypothetical protein